MNRSKQKGTRFAQAVADYLKEHGFPLAERRAQEGYLDRGDIAGVKDVVIECKAEKAFHLSEYIKETMRERENAGASEGFAFVKAPGKPISQTYVITTLEQWCDNR